MIFSVIQSANAMLVAKTPLELYNEHELIVTGKVISLTEISNRETIYNVKVEEYLKNPKPYDIIDAYGLGAKNGGIVIEDDTIFEIGDRVLLYLYKEDGKYKISQYSFIAPESCDKHQLLELATIPGEPIRRGGPPKDQIRLTDLEGNESDKKFFGNDLILINNEIVISYDAWNDYRNYRDFDIEILITTEKNEPVFYEKHVLYNLEPCSGPLTESWHFVPKRAGLHNAKVTFVGVPITYSFVVRENLSGGSVDKTSYPLSPLKQFKSGVPANAVECREGLLRVIKSRDGSPACVQPLTYNKLAERGWANLLGSQTTFYVFANDTRYEISYHVTGWRNKVLNMTADLETNSLTVSMQNKNKGELIVTIPKTLFDAKTSPEKNTDFFVLIDGEESEIKSKKKTDIDTTLKIGFSEVAKKIEIIQITLL